MDVKVKESKPKNKLRGQTNTKTFLKKLHCNLREREGKEKGN